MIRKENHATGGNDNPITQSIVARGALHYRKLQSRHLVEREQIRAAEGGFPYHG